MHAEGFDEDRAAILVIARVDDVLGVEGVEDAALRDADVQEAAEEQAEQERRQHEEAGY